MTETETTGKTIASVMLFLAAIIADFATKIASNYDVIFKLLSLLSLSLIVLINVGKVAKMLYLWAVSVYKFFKDA